MIKNLLVIVFKSQYNKLKNTKLLQCNSKKDPK